MVNGAFLHGKAGKHSLGLQLAQDKIWFVSPPCLGGYPFAHKNFQQNAKNFQCQYFFIWTLSIEGSGPSVNDPLPFLFEAMRWFVSDVWRAMHDLYSSSFGGRIRSNPGQCSRAVPKAKAVDAWGTQHQQSGTVWVHKCGTEKVMGNVHFFDCGLEIAKNVRLFVSPPCRTSQSAALNPLLSLSLSV